MASILLSSSVIILLILGSIWSTHCETNASSSATLPESRIIGGTFASPGEFSHQILMALNVGNGKHKICGGSIISNQHILLAAHCVYCAETSKVGIIPGKLEIDFSNLSPISVSVSHIFVHPCYFQEKDREKSTHLNDIAIVKLSNPLQFSSTINLIALDNTGLAVPGIVATTVGWGTTKSSDLGIRSKILKKAQLDIVNDREQINSNTQILTFNSAEFVCSGDSGGPLLCPANSEGNVLCGVTSLALDNGLQACIGPSVFTRVSHYQNWIKAIQSGDHDSSEGCIGQPRKPICPTSSGSIINQALRVNIIYLWALSYTWAEGTNSNLF